MAKQLIYEAEAREKLKSGVDQLANAVSVVFVEGVVLTPLTDTVDIKLGALRTNTPGNLHRRALLLRILRPRSRTQELYCLTRVGRQRLWLMVTVDHVAIVIQIIEIGRITSENFINYWYKMTRRQNRFPA